MIEHSIKYKLVIRVLSFLKSVSLLSLMATVSVFSQKYEISISMKTKNDTVMLTHVFAKKEPVWLDTTIVLKNGKGVFKGNKVLPKGLYSIYNNRRKYDIIIGDHQVFGIVIDTADFIKQTKFTDSPDNDVFFKYLNHNNERNKHLQQLSELYKNATSDAEKNDINAKRNILSRESLEYIDKLIEENKQLYVSKIIKSLIPILARLPEPPRDELGNITDPNFQYRWWRSHFFDNLNIFDPDMLRTEFYEDKVLEYMTRVIPQHTDTICAELDKILEKARINDEIFRCILVSVYNLYADSKDIVRGYVVPENVWIHLVEKWYIPYATWSTDENIENLRKEVANRKPNLIGKHAPPMEMLVVLPTEHFKAAALDTAIMFNVYAGKIIEDFRKELKSKFTVLLFWEFTCSHCKQTIQELFKVWEEYKDDGLQVLTVQIHLTDRKDKGKWIDFVNEKNLFGAGWINAWSPYSYKYKELYNLPNVPVIYLLDENFDIILRGNLKGNIGAETIKEFFDNQMKNQQ